MRPFVVFPTFYLGAAFFAFKLKNSRGVMLTSDEQSRFGSHSTL